MVYVQGSDIFWDYVIDFTISSLACPDIITWTYGPSGSLRTIYILHNPFYTIYIFCTLYSWIFFNQVDEYTRNSFCKGNIQFLIYSKYSDESRLKLEH